MLKLKHTLACGSHVLPQDVMKLISAFSEERIVFEGFHVFTNGHVTHLVVDEGAMETRLAAVYKNMLIDDAVGAAVRIRKEAALIDQAGAMKARMKQATAVEVYGYMGKKIATFSRTFQPQSRKANGSRTLIDFAMPRCSKTFETWWPLQTLFLEMEKQPGWVADLNREFAPINRVVVTFPTSIFHPLAETPAVSEPRRKKRRVERKH